MVESGQKIYEPKILDELLIYVRERWNEVGPQMKNKFEISGGIKDALFKILSFVYSKLSKQDLIKHFRTTLACDSGETIDLMIKP